MLRPRGRMVAYVTLATELLEPGEAGALVDAMALVPESLDSATLESAAEDGVAVLLERLDGGAVVIDREDAETGGFQSGEGGAAR